MRNPFALAAAIFVASFLLFLIGNNNHSVWDRDEPRYCQATREMLVTGDWIVPHFNGNIRYDKPPLTYWLMAPAMKAFGFNEFAARFPAALMGATRTTVIFAFALAMGCSLGGAIVAAGAAALMALLLLISKAATTDSTLVLTVVVSMYAFWHLLTREFQWRHVILLGAAFGFSILVKGPPGLAVVGIAAVGFFAWNWYSPVTAVRGTLTGTLAATGVCAAVALAISLPWVIAVSVQTDGEFLRHAIGRHVVERVQEPMEGHSGPFFYYLFLLPLLLFPVTPMAANAMAWATMRQRSLEMRFLWCWFLPGLVMFSMVSTKLPHYVAPLLPAVALMIGLWWTAREQQTPSAQGGWRIAGGVFVTLLGIAAIVVPPMLIRVAELPFSLAPFIAFGAVLAIAMIGGSYHWIGGRDQQAVIWWAGGWTATLLIALVWVLPTVESVRGSKPLAKWLHANAPDDVEVLAIDYQEPSFVFYWGDGVNMVGRREKGWMWPLFGELNDTEIPRALVTTGETWDKFTEEYRGWRHPQLGVVFREPFFQFEQGKWIELVVVGNWTTEHVEETAGD